MARIDQHQQAGIRQARKASGEDEFGPGASCFLFDQLKKRHRAPHTPVVTALCCVTCEHTLEPCRKRLGFERSRDALAPP